MNGYAFDMLNLHTFTRGLARRVIFLKGNVIRLNNVFPAYLGLLVQRIDTMQYIIQRIGVTKQTLPPTG